MKKYSTDALVHTQEKSLFVVSLVVSLLMWLILVVASVGFGVFIILVAALFFVCVRYIFIAHIKGFGIRVSASQYGELYRKAKEICGHVHIHDVPEMYVYHMDSMLNAFALKIFSRKFVVITTQMLEACGDDEELIGFILAHEIAHHARKHLVYSSLLWPSSVLPWLGKAYSRACEYTCDAYGAQFGATSLQKAKEAVTILATASYKKSATVNTSEYLSQARDISEFWASVVNSNSSHPFTTLRYARIEKMFGDGSVKMPKSNIFGVVLSPFFSLGFAIVFIYVSIFGVALLSGLSNADSDQGYYDTNYDADYDVDYGTDASSTVGDVPAE